ncbi:MAG: ferritin-like domain-containing protein [Sphingomonas sp.]|uniref:ferritin-like domain-containing protein n=1 Tax=Sphingomonas sp. TaxID=28214 RepID=UPI0011FC90DC|nr:ferritin-like domain-containing protein [Sphingomonas sp.]THD36152.1 MAG: ferritin-like domain-containing protein [Sphingomonas sp.]
MADDLQLIEAFDSRVKRRSERREFFKAAIGAAAVGATTLLVSQEAFAQTLIDADFLNFALNLEYLEAQFYSYAATGAGLSSTLLGTSPGAVTATNARRVDNLDSDPLVRDYAREIAADEVAHVTFLRAQLGTSAIVQPAIDISTGATSAFGKAAVAAGLPATFDPYSSPENFLLGAFIFEDVGVTAYKGLVPLLASKTYVEATSGIMAVEAYHAAMVRTALYAKGVATPSLRTSADAISDARDSLDGTVTDDDQGISPVTINGGTASNVAPLDADGLAYARSTGQVLNIVYLTNTAVSMGGFFPAGVNGNIKTSAAN